MLHDAMPAFLAEETPLVDVFGEEFRADFEKLGVTTVGELLECPEIPSRLDMALAEVLCK